MFYTYKFRLYPNKVQKEILEKHFGCNRFVYNYFLQKTKDHYVNTKKTLTWIDNSKSLTQLKKELSWLTEVNAQSLQQTLKHLYNAYIVFFKNVKNNKKGKKGYPKFKNKVSKQSFVVPQNVKIKSNKILLPKIKNGIKFCKNRDIIGNIKRCTIFKNKTNQYFITVYTEKELVKLNQSNKIIGIDFNIQNIVCSDGQKYKNPLPEQKFYKHIKLLLKSVSRKKKGSNSRNKAKIKLNKLLQYCSNIRKDFAHKISKKIINENQVIIIENLDLKDLRRKKNNESKIIRRKRNRLLSDCNISDIIYKLEYKTKWYNRELIKVDKFFPSSKLCSICGFKNEQLKINERSWECPICNTKHDRDLNAAKNILIEGLRIKNSTVGATEIADCPSIRPVLDGQLVGSEISIRNSSQVSAHDTF